MNIQVMNEYCAKVELSADECSVFGIDYESFSGSDPSTRLFISAVLRKIREMELSACYADKITAEVFRTNGGGLLVYLSGKGLRLAGNAGERVDFCDTPTEVIELLSHIPEPESASLYKYAGRYAVISDQYDKRLCSEPCFCAKIKEYGELVSDTPFLKLMDKITREEM